MRCLMTLILLVGDPNYAMLAQPVNPLIEQLIDFPIEVSKEEYFLSIYKDKQIVFMFTFPGCQPCEMFKRNYKENKVYQLVEIKNHNKPLAPTFRYILKDKVVQRVGYISPLELEKQLNGNTFELYSNSIQTD